MATQYEQAELKLREKCFPYLLVSSFLYKYKVPLNQLGKLPVKNEQNM